MVAQQYHLHLLAELHQRLHRGERAVVVEGLQDVVADERQGRRSRDVVLDRRQTQRQEKLVALAFRQIGNRLAFVGETAMHRHQSGRSVARIIDLDPRVGAAGDGAEQFGNTRQHAGLAGHFHLGQRRIQQQRGQMHQRRFFGDAAQRRDRCLLVGRCLHRGIRMRLRIHLLLRRRDPRRQRLRIATGGIALGLRGLDRAGDVVHRNRFDLGAQLR